MSWKRIRGALPNRSLTVGTLALATATTAGYYTYQRTNSDKNTPNFSKLPPNHPILKTPQGAISLDAPNDPEGMHSLWSPPSREEMLQKLRNSALNAEEELDLLVVGGGATGAGIALDAASRGLKVGLVERDDYSSGTSSKSTKLVHGGVRYLEKAFRNLDYEQYKLVVEALHERAIFLHTAPHLSSQLPIMLPVYKWWQVPYFWVGSKTYDFLSGAEGLQSSYFMSRDKTLETFPMLKKDQLVGSMVYYDGQHNDSRMNVSLILTAIFQGAIAVNHTEVTELIKESSSNGTVVRGAKVRDTLTGETFNIKAKGVINATGPFTDGLRKMDIEESKEIVAPSSGVHIVLPNYYSPSSMGMLDPSTSDGRVIFFLPWEGNVVAGTTDTPTNVTSDPIPEEQEIQWILDEIRRYLSPDINVRRGDVLSAWSGIRPLVRDPSAKSTEGLVRNHMINVSENQLITIAGGKWTTYRAMAEETVDKAIEIFNLKPKNKCVTESLKLIGAHGYSSNMFIKLIQHFGLETEVAKHLAANYGDRAWGVVAYAEVTGQRWPLFGKKLSPCYPYLEAEVRYAVNNEYAFTAVDVLARRTRLSFLNSHAAKEALPRVISIMSAELGWDHARQRKEYDDSLKFLATMGLNKDETLANSKKSQAGFTPSPFRASFRPKELAIYREAFSKCDTDKDGHINYSNLHSVLEQSGFTQLTSAQLDQAVAKVNVNKSGSVEFYEFLEILSCLKDAQTPNVAIPKSPLNKFSTVRSGGGV